MKSNVHFMARGGTTLRFQIFDLSIHKVMGKQCDEHLYGKMTIQFKHFVTKFTIARCALYFF